MCLLVPGIAVLQRGVRQERPMGVAQRADVPAVVPVGSVLLRLGYAAVDIWRRAVRETPVKRV